MSVKKPHLWQLAAALVLSIPALVWFWFDQHVWEWDQSRYAHMSFDLWQYQTADPTTWRWMLFRHLPTKAPGISWMGQFFVYLEPLVGSVNRALMVQMATCTVLSALLLAATVRRLHPQRPLWSWVALLACFSSPLFLNLNQEYMTEPVQMLGICWVLWVAVSAPEKKPARVLAEMLAAMAFLMISKGVSPLYVWGFGLWFLAGFVPRLFGRKREPFGLSVGSGLGLVCATGFFVLVAVWYRLNASHVFGYVVDASSGSVALAYGSKAGWWEKNLLWLGFLGRVYASPALLLGLGLMIPLGVWTLWRSRLDDRAHRGLLLASAAQIALVWYLVTRSPTEEWRPLMGLLPSFLLLLVALLSRVRLRAVPVLLIAIQLGQWGAFHARAFGLASPPWFSSGQALRVWDRSGERLQELERIIRTTCELCPSMEQAMMCAVSVPWLNSNTLRYYAATVVDDTPRYGYYGSTGFLTTELPQLLTKFREQDPCVLITMDPAEQARLHTGSTASLPFFDYIATDPGYEPVPFRSAFGVFLYQKKPSTPALSTP